MTFIPLAKSTAQGAQVDNKQGTSRGQRSEQNSAPHTALAGTNRSHHAYKSTTPRTHVPSTCFVAALGGARTVPGPAPAPGDGNGGEAGEEEGDVGPRGVDPTDTLRRFDSREDTRPVPAPAPPAPDSPSSSRALDDVVPSGVSNKDSMLFRRTQYLTKQECAATQSGPCHHNNNARAPVPAQPLPPLGHPAPCQQQRLVHSSTLPTTQHYSASPSRVRRHITESTHSPKNNGAWAWPAIP
jgi:hypothetical protein